MSPSQHRKPLAPYTRRQPGAAALVKPSFGSTNSTWRACSSPAAQPVAQFRSKLALFLLKKKLLTPPTASPPGLQHAYPVALARTPHGWENQQVNRCQGFGIGSERGAGSRGTARMVVGAAGGGDAQRWRPGGADLARAHGDNKNAEICSTGGHKFRSTWNSVAQIGRAHV